ncbi:DUF2783 domain-containing protein [Noviherbaspirillum sedimenti]|uniref:DUF2783 domain-containing protein n=1 Tax=Noviherbaspirillum sedimenti TaxID=2320865 RepID=A0A3A3G7N0_9BURK|nr:DUF2783 domain-containing protein [Noviherbaspirillum sedimenti]RJG02562.1 DUF2783 domain-containing protein [Noviherbaspirillum sedimenti]
MSQSLNLEPNLDRVDDFYQMLIDTHQGLSDAESQTVNAKLVLVLANHIGDINVLKQALEIAKAGA